MRYSDVCGDAIRSGANDWKSCANRSITAIIGSRTSRSYVSRRALNHSRSLFFLSARRKEMVRGEKQAAMPTILRQHGRPSVPQRGVRECA
jgi:hypothetical protein